TTGTPGAEACQRWAPGNGGRTSGGMVGSTIGGRPGTVKVLGPGVGGGGSSEVGRGGATAIDSLTSVVSGATAICGSSVVVRAGERVGGGSRWGRRRSLGGWARRGHRDRVLGHGGLGRRRDLRVQRGGAGRGGGRDRGDLVAAAVAFENLWAVTESEADGGDHHQRAHREHRAVDLGFAFARGGGGHPVRHGLAALLRAGRSEE